PIWDEGGEPLLDGRAERLHAVEEAVDDPHTGVIEVDAINPSEDLGIDLVELGLNLVNREIWHEGLNHPLHRPDGVGGDIGDTLFECLPSAHEIALGEPGECLPDRADGNRDVVESDSQPLDTDDDRSAELLA